MTWVSIFETVGREDKKREKRERERVRERERERERERREREERKRGNDEVDRVVQVLRGGQTHARSCRCRCCHHPCWRGGASPCRAIF
jgi:hypothetical protein